MKKYFQYIIVVFASVFVTNAIAQNGEALFKSKCNTCHLLEKNSTGPNLKGVKQKWVDAGEGELLYEWVKNSKELILSGNSTMAKAIEGFSPTTMGPQDATPEEVDAILDYVDNYVAPAPEAEATAEGEPVVVVKPDYKANLKQFYFMIALTVVLIIAIFVMQNAVNTLIKSDYFRNRIKEIDEAKEGNGGIKTLIAIIVFIGFVASPSHALEFMPAGTAEEGMPWLLVENSDLWVMVIIDLILLAVLLYMRRMFKSFARMTQTEEEAVEESAEALKKVNSILTDAVPIEEEHTILMHHEYDGIRELDNNLPPWWVWGFYATIVFSVIYLFNYHILGTSDLQIEAYNKEIKQAEIDVQNYLDKMAMNVDENTATLMTDASDLSKGGELFEVNCVACHGPQGGGNIGPNLTDNAWVYGYEIGNLFKTIKNGTANGMPEHASKLNPVQIQQVASYVLSLDEVDGKEPEGTIIEE